MRRRTFTIDTTDGAGTIAGIEWGPEAQPLDLLFLHANGFNACTYSPILAPLAATLRVLAVDLRGHGATTLPLPASHTGWRLYARDLLALIAALGETPRILAGHSMGGTTAMLAAPSLPAVERLVLFDPVIVPAALYAQGASNSAPATPLALAAARRKAHFASRDEAFAAYRHRGGFKTWPDETLHAYLQDGLRPADEGLVLTCTPNWEAANFNSYAGDDPTIGLPATEPAIQILRAEQGSTCALDRNAPGLSVETLPGTTHFLPMERPAIVRAALATPALHAPFIEQDGR